MAKKTKAKELTLKKLLKETRKPIVEINVSDPCEHECHSIWSGSAAVWRIGSTKPWSAKAEAGVVMHVCSNDPECLNECWGGN
jgi:hypothetical protein